MYVILELEFGFDNEDNHIYTDPVGYVETKAEAKAICANHNEGQLDEHAAKYLYGWKRRDWSYYKFKKINKLELNKKPVEEPEVKTLYEL